MKHGIFRPSGQETVIFARPWLKAAIEEIDRIGARRVFVLASATFASKTELEPLVQDALGERLGGFAMGIRAHSPREDVVMAANQVRESGSDFILAIGGGSVIEAAKIMQLCLAVGAEDADQLGKLAHIRQPQLPATLPVRMGAVPTTLSGAEFTYFGGATDTVRKVKEAYIHPLMVPRFVVLDPAATLHTPTDLWFSTGMPAVDHAIEALCSTGAHPMSDAASIQALKLLAASLPQTHDNPADLDARLDSLCGMWLATMDLQSGVPMGASHGIGHALGGTAGVPHGVTSCLMLPWVLRWNKAVNADRQFTVSAAMNETGVDAGDIVAHLVQRLGLSGQLRNANVSREQFEEIAEHALHDPWTQANPRPITSASVIVELLESAW
ncbi:MAG TPA: iron-containing alcohol dehydrogenase [Terriglobales bacterium]|nr:iron-containing alcohol dehydrogenase [Terriglobales bacterium]